MRPSEARELIERVWAQNHGDGQGDSGQDVRDMRNADIEAARAWEKQEQPGRDDRRQGGGMQEMPLVGYIEIAERAGVQRHVVTMWRSRWSEDTDTPFPQPVAVLKVGPVWWWPNVEGWLKRTGRL